MARLSTLHKNLYDIVNLELLALLMKNYKLTYSQAFYLYVLYKDKLYMSEMSTDSIKRPLSYLYKFAEIIPFTYNEIKELEDIGLIKIWKGQDVNVIYPDNVELNQVFLDFVFVNSNDFQKIYEAYPSHMRINDKIVYLKASDLTELEKIYKTQVVDKNTHNFVLDLINKSKPLNLITVGFDKFIKNKMWTSLSQIYNEYIKDRNNNDVYSI